MEFSFFCMILNILCLQSELDHNIFYQSLIWPPLFYIQQSFWRSFSKTPSVNSVSFIHLDKHSSGSKLRLCIFYWFSLFFYLYYVANLPLNGSFNTCRIKDMCSKLFMSFNGDLMSRCIFFIQIIKWH